MASESVGLETELGVDVEFVSLDPTVGVVAAEVAKEFVDGVAEECGNVSEWFPS